METPIAEIKSIKATIPLESFISLGGKLNEGMDIISYDDKGEPIHWSLEDKKEYVVEMLSKYKKHNVLANICLFDSVCVILNELQLTFQGGLKDWNMQVTEPNGE